MSFDNGDLTNKKSDYLFEKINKGYNHYINLKKKKNKNKDILFKYSDSFNHKDNSHDYFYKKKSNKIKTIQLRTEFNSISTNPKSIFTNISNISKDIFKKEKKFNEINLKTSFNSYKLKPKVHFNNITEQTKEKAKYDSIFTSKKLSYDKELKFDKSIKKSNLKNIKLNILSPLLIHKRTNLNTSTSDKNKYSLYKIRKKIKKKTLNPFKYENNYTQNHFLKQIIENPNLKLLYETDEKRVKNMVKSKSKSNKKRLNLINYQNNLINNSLIPLTAGDKRNLLISFKKINSSIKSREKIDLFNYLQEIQQKEKTLVENHNKLNEEYAKNIEKIGFSAQKRKLHIGKMEFTDIFKEKKYMKKYKNKFNF